MNKKKLYIAYGSNLNLKQMAIRCPTAKPVGRTILRNWQLTFRGVATLVQEVGSETPVGVWEIAAQDEIALDRYEGYPNLYRKEMLEIEIGGKPANAMVYLMNDGLPNLPNSYYFNTIAQGYDDIGLDKVHLKKALEHTQKLLEKKKIIN